MQTKLHIITLDIPWPANYGGAIEMFYKIVRLHEAGVGIILHCFQYGNRKPAKELEQYCLEINYYKRQTGLRGLHYSLPYIVSSRNSTQLLHKLQQDTLPVLFDGLHTTYWMQHPALASRTSILRAHNIESEYYRSLAEGKKGFFKRMYYHFEQSRLAAYERSLSGMQHILCISEPDRKWFAAQYPHVAVHYLPAFHAYKTCESQTGKGSFAFFHGHLSVEENRKAVFFLAEVFKDLPYRLIIAGRDPGPEVRALDHGNIGVVADPDEATMNRLTREANIHVLPGFQKTGMKLKLLHALHAGRFIITNDKSLGDELTDSSIRYANTVEDYRRIIRELMDKEFTPGMLQDRKHLTENLHHDGMALLLQLIETKREVVKG